jgi:pimeloyl-ACP methyl ester carboxylesterase
MSLSKHILLLLGFMLSTSTTMAQINVNCQGKGQPVYLIGGGPAFTTWNLEPIQQQLRDHFKVCRWDMRGVGDNAKLDINKGAPVLMQWIQDMAMVLPQQPVILWGHSWGALQTLLFAKHYPERVKALVLNNPVDPELRSLENIEFNRYVHPYVESQLNIEDIDTFAEKRHHFRSKIASYFMDAEKGWAYSAGFDAGDTNNELNVQVWEEYRRMPINKADLDSLSPKIARIIYCEYDVLMPESLEVYSRVVSSEKLYVLNDCAHFPWVESPEEFFHMLLRTMTAVR